MAQLVHEWSYFGSTFLSIVTSPAVLLYLCGGTVIGYIIGVIPGLGATRGMALVLGVIFRLPQFQGLALLIGILVSSMSSGGITASLANIPGTSAAAATVMDGYPMTLKGKGREACGYAYVSSCIGSILAMVLVFFIQPFIAAVALRFGNWETFLFCLFGVLLCGSLVGGDPIRGWISAFVGIFVSMCGAESVQSVVRYTLGTPKLLSGVSSVVAILALFGLGEVLYTLSRPTAMKVKAQSGFPIVRLSVFVRNLPNILRSLLAGLWVGFIPGIGESAACWFSYDLARKSEKNGGEFGTGVPEGIIAAEVANNASSVGELIPSLALGIPGSGSTAVFIAALFLIGYRPGPTLMTDAPGVLCAISILFVLSALLMLVAGYFLSRFAIKFLTIEESLLMPLIVIFCAIGAYATTYTKFSLILLLVFGVLGYLMKVFGYPIPPMLLGLLVGNTMDTALRRAMMQYGNAPLEMITRPFGIGIFCFLMLMLFFSIRTTKRTKQAHDTMEEKERLWEEGGDEAP